MDVLINWEASHVAHWAALALVLIAATLIAWFPGYNAFQHAHETASRVRVAGWALVLAMAWLITTGWDAMALGPSFVAFWAAIVVWSYGKRISLRIAGSKGGFEVKLVHPEQSPAALEQTSVLTGP